MRAWRVILRSFWRSERILGAFWLLSASRSAFGADSRFLGYLRAHSSGNCVSVMGRGFYSCVMVEGIYGYVMASRSALGASWNGLRASWNIFEDFEASWNRFGNHLWVSWASRSILERAWEICAPKQGGAPAGL